MTLFLLIVLSGLTIYLVYKKVKGQRKPSIKPVIPSVTEPSGGSDVAALKTTAIRDGDHYVVNGE